jgi:hypothetical protein
MLPAWSQDVKTQNNAGKKSKEEQEAKQEQALAEAEIRLRLVQREVARFVATVSTAKERTSRAVLHPRTVLCGGGTAPEPQDSNEHGREGRGDSFSKTTAAASPAPRRCTFPRCSPTRRMPS